MIRLQFHVFKRSTKPLPTFEVWRVRKNTVTGEELRDPRPITSAKNIERVLQAVPKGYNRIRRSGDDEPELVERWM